MPIIRTRANQQKRKFKNSIELDINSNLQIDEWRGSEEPESLLRDAPCQMS
jgi:hypothetical protein